MLDELQRRYGVVTEASPRRDKRVTEASERRDTDMKKS